MVRKRRMSVKPSSPLPKTIAQQAVGGAKELVKSVKSGGIMGGVRAIGEGVKGLTPKMAQPRKVRRGRKLPMKPVQKVATKGTLSGVGLVNASRKGSVNFGGNARNYGSGQQKLESSLYKMSKKKSFGALSDKEARMLKPGDLYNKFMARKKR